MNAFCRWRRRFEPPSERAGQSTRDLLHRSRIWRAHSSSTSTNSIAIRRCTGRKTTSFALSGGALSPSHVACKPSPSEVLEPDQVNWLAWALRASAGRKVAKNLHGAAPRVLLEVVTARRLQTRKLQTRSAVRPPIRALSSADGGGHAALCAAWSVIGAAHAHSSGRARQTKQPPGANPGSDSACVCAGARELVSACARERVSA